MSEIKESVAEKDAAEPEEIASKPITDEFAYIENKGFTSEIFKLEVRNLPKYYGINELKKLLNNKLSLASNKIKVPRQGSPFAYICFRSEEEVESALAKLNGYNWKGKELQASRAKPAPDPMAKKRNLEAGIDGVITPKKRKTLQEATTPLAYLPYEAQVKQKSSEMEEVLRKFGNELWKQGCREYVEAQRKLHNGLPCQFDGIRASPDDVVAEGYRNKNEFSIGKDCNDETVVGFRLGSYANGTIEVGRVDELKHLPKIAKQCCMIFEKFVNTSELKPFNSETHDGNFRQLTVRVGQATRELMLIVGIHPQNLTDEKLKGFKESLVEFFTVGDGKELNVDSLYYQTIEKRVSGQMTNPLEHIHGKTHITDKILGYTFQISPDAFFQVNTKGAEILYQTAIDLGKPTEKTTLLDICCGTGTIGLCFAKHCKKVLGVELIEQAVKDAASNAQANGIENAEFLAGNSDDFIGTLMRKASADGGETDVLAILDPPRAGLHVRSIMQLRNAKGLNRLVYIACSPSSVIKNWVDLQRPCSKSLKGDPFFAKMAVAVDMFPHTPHTELVVLFERESPDSKDAAN